jgi:hypothetical protein
MTTKPKYSCCRSAIATETADLKKTVGMLMDACKELMAESDGRRAANWEIVNDAMVAGDRVVPVTMERSK